jgi:hypothetical protein
MRYRITLQKHQGFWVHVITFGNDTPTAMEQIEKYSDDCVSAQDLHGVRHFVFFKDRKIVQIQLHDALRILPNLDPEHPETVRMPGMHAIMFGEPPVPTLLISYKQEPLENRTAYGLSPHVFLVFNGPDLASLYVIDVNKTITPDSPRRSLLAGLRSWLRAVLRLVLKSATPGLPHRPTPPDPQE